MTLDPSTTDLLADLALSRFTVDRAAHIRSQADWLDQAWAADTTRVLIVHDNRVPVTDELSIVWLKPTATELAHIDRDSDTLVLLGADDDHTYVGVLNFACEIDGVTWASLRDIGARLSSLDVGLATAGTALAQWHRTHQFCNSCGAATVITAAGWARTCPAESRELYPRTEPAVIAAIEDADGRILLGRRNEWQPGWFSTLAGFVEAGESAEAALHREILEESGVHIDARSIRYLGSQPWPFPASLMLGYRATATSTTIVADEEEMAEVRWFSRDEFIAECNSGALRLPNPVSLAWRLIESWFGQPLESTWSR